MIDLHNRVQDVKDLMAHAVVTQDPVDQAKSNLAFWSLMNDHGPQILDIVDDALQAYKEGKL